MQIKEVMLRAMNKEYSWLRAAEILGITPRGLRRLRQQMEQFGYQGLVDMRRGRPSPRRTPVPEIERILELYRERYAGFNVRHFHQTVRREHGVKLSYSCVKQILQGAGLVKKRRSRGRHRMKRPRKPRRGEMLHLDGSLHAWLSLVPEEKQTLIQVVDDATSRLLYAQLWQGETSRAVMSALREVIQVHGIPQSLYTDRASWAFETPKAGGKVDKAHLTQVGAALARLGIEHIPSYSPQGRGRSERMNRTLQDRLVNELRVAGVTTLEAANAYLRERYLPTHNAEFAREPIDSMSAFVDLDGADLDEIFYEEVVRKVGKDNTVSVEGLRLQIGKQAGRRTCAGLAVHIRRHLDGRYTVRRGTQLFGVYEADGRSRLVSAAATPRRTSKAVQRGTSRGKSRNATQTRTRVPASGRLRLPPAGTHLSQAATKT
jgi:transposase